MQIMGSEFVDSQVSSGGYFFKAILNESGAAFFPRTTEHCEFKLVGLSYEDDSKGNALAAIITKVRIEIRNHRGFSPVRVAKIIRTLKERAELACLVEFLVEYQGNQIV